MSQATYSSFAEQALHYFDRPHEAVCREPIRSPAAWRGQDLARRTDWQVPLGAEDVAALERAAATVRQRGLEPSQVTRGDFDVPLLHDRIRAWRDELVHGRGFVLVRGLPVARWGEEVASLVYWDLGLHLGRPGAQNPQGDLL
jgi:hypothetical protein